MSKQDRQGARTPANLEQKYSFGRVFSQQERENARQNEEMNQQNLTMKQFISFATTSIDKLQKDLTATNKTIDTLQKDLATAQKDLTAANETIDALSEREKKVREKVSIYVSLTDENPADLFGGTWERIEDSFLLAAGSTYSAGSTGGEATHTLTENEMPSHKHDTFAPEKTGSDWNYFISATASAVNTSNFIRVGTTNATGGSQPHNNMPPYYTVYMWRRTA